MAELDQVTKLSKQFTEELYGGYHYLARTMDYEATAFRTLLDMRGGVDTARILLRGRAASDGFSRLRQEEMLDHSLEASVIRPRYAALFTEPERGIARRRLAQHDFDVEAFLATCD